MWVSLKKTKTKKKRDIVSISLTYYCTSSMILVPHKMSRYHGCFESKFERKVLQQKSGIFVSTSSFIVIVPVVSLRPPALCLFLFQFATLITILGSSAFILPTHFTYFTPNMWDMLVGWGQKYNPYNSGIGRLKLKAKFNYLNISL